MKKYFLIVLVSTAIFGCKSKSTTENVTIDEARAISEVNIVEIPEENIMYDRILSEEAPHSIKFTPPIIATDEAVSNDLSMSYDECIVADRPVEVISNDEYSSFKENKFKSPLSEALSTFSIDVDGASYSNFRRMINLGQTPPLDAVRVEEFINYFDYDYAQPTKENPIQITAEVGECPWRKENRLLRVALKSREIPEEELPKSNLVFLIDISGSMSSSDRLPLVKSSLKLLVNNLREEDRVSIVTYAGNANSVLQSTKGSDKQTINNALDKLSAGGYTAGGQGIELAYKIAKENFIKDGNNRIIMCSDGDFNVGVSSNEGLEVLIERQRKSGVFLSVLGYGMGNYKDAKMQILAEKEW